MPEGDTVWLAGQHLHAALAGRVLLRTDFRVPSLATTDLSGHEVLEVVSRGKHLLTRIDGDVPMTLHTHFRMDGTWHLYRPGDPWTGGPDWQVRVVLEVADRVAVGFRLPVVELLPTAEEDTAVGHLGPDLLGADWDATSAEQAVRRLRADPGQEIGLALLDQRNLAGLGNLYRCELLFLRGISPWTPVGEVDASLDGVVALAHRLLFANRSTHLQVTTGDTRRGRQHYVFERTGRPCLRCGTAIARAEQGELPYQRLTYWCPSCQPSG